MSETEDEGPAGIMLIESEGLIRKMPRLLDCLDESDRRRVLDIGREVGSKRTSRYGGRAICMKGST